LAIAVTETPEMQGLAAPGGSVRASRRAPLAGAGKNVAGKIWSFGHCLYRRCLRGSRRSVASRRKGAQSP